MEQTDILVKSTLDGTMQPSLLFRAADERRPVLVGLHSWSYDRFNQIKNMLSYAEENGFHLLLPEFRGANLESNPNRTQACGSMYAKQDIIDAVDHLVNIGLADRDNIFLLGASGGGHMALMMAGYKPEYFKAIGAFVPITDLQKWAGENPRYRPHVLACCSDDEEQMRLRSPMTYADTIVKANLKIFHGKYDPVVPVSHSLNLYQKLMQTDPEAKVYLDIFDGGHELVMQQAMYWLLSQYRKKEDKVQVTG